MPAEPTPSELKAAHRHAWGKLGNYAPVGETLAPASQDLLARLQAGAGTRMLDVAAGTGNLAIPAARAGADVVAVDLTPEILEVGRRRAAEQDVAVRWRQADAEALPFGDGEFDVVTSVFGAIFAPRHRVVAEELVRVCAPGGQIGLTAWTPEGFIGQTMQASAEFVPAPPSYAQPAIRWGEEGHVRELFAGLDVALDLGRATVRWEFADPESFQRFFESHGSLHIVALQAARAQGREDELRARAMEVVERFNAAEDGSCVIDGEYLVILGRRSEG